MEELPDHLLATIVSMLPPKAAARTTAISRRWRPIWPSLPLDLHDLHLDADAAARTRELYFLGSFMWPSSVPLDLHLDADSDARYLSNDAINSLLSSSHRNPTPIRRFCVTAVKGVGTCAWLRTLAERRIDDTLILRFTARHTYSYSAVHRGLLGRAAVSLRRLELHCCRILPNVLGSLRPNLPCVECMYLSNVAVDETDLHCMIEEACPALRELRLFMIHGLRCVCFRSRTLTTMSISRPCAPLDEFNLRDMPALQHITFSYVDPSRIPSFSVNVDGPRLREFVLKLPNVGSPGLSTFSNKIPLPFVTLLVLGMKFTNCEELSKALHILTSFTCLQRLEILCFYFGSDNEVGHGDWESMSDNMVIWQNKHLKHVRLIGYCGTMREVGFARSLMVGAQSLRAMDISHAVDWTPEDITRQTESICINGKASPSAQLSFTRSAQPDDVRRKIAGYLDTAPMV